jgi:hypothetical protein
MNNLGHVPTHDPLIDMMEYIQEMAERNFLKDGNLCPVLFILNDEGVKIIGIPEFGDPKMKEAVLDSIQMGIADQKIKKLIILIEAWMGSGNEAIQHYRHNASLANYDNKEECILMLYSSPQQEIISMAKIIRDGEKVSFSDWVESRGIQPEIAAIFGGKLNALWSRTTANTN